MILPNGQPILMDFGIVKMLGGDTHTATGALVGTVAYMAPEQIRGGRADHRTDIYALGVMLFEMVSGQRPFQGDSAPSTMMMHLTHPVPDVRTLNPVTPRSLVATIGKSLAKDPADRFQSTAEMNAALTAVGVHEGPTRVEAVGPTVRGQTVPTPVAPPPPRRPIAATGSVTAAPIHSTGSVVAPAPEPAKGSRRLLIGGGAAAMLVVLLLLCGISAAFGGQYLGLFGGADTATPTTPIIVAEATLANVTIAAALPTDTAGVPATAAVLPSPTNAPVLPTATVAPLATATSSPTPTPSPTETPTDTPAPTATPTTAGLSATITQILIDGNQYRIFFTTAGYTAQLPGRHVHFFFDTVTEAQAGVPGGGPWKLYGGPSPFTEYLVSDRPAGASRMCILVANADHSIQPGSGNCVALP
jgi:serine/threonine-protein kinase